jgi:hypothetical protein
VVVPFVVVVLDRDPGARRERETVVYRHRAGVHPAPLVVVGLGLLERKVDDAHARVANRLDALDRVIGAGIAHDDHLELAVGLAEDGPETPLAQELGPVEGREDHRDERIRRVGIGVALMRPRRSELSRVVEAPLIGPRREGLQLVDAPAELAQGELCLLQLLPEGLWVGAPKSVNEPHARAG